MQLTSNIWSTFPFWKRFIADGDVKLKFLINFWTNLFNIYNKNEYEKHKFKKKYIIKWRLAKNVQNINYISYILYAKYIFKCFSVMSIETQFRKRKYTRFVIACVCTATCWLKIHLNWWVILNIETLASPMICLGTRLHSHAWILIARHVNIQQPWYCVVLMLYRSSTLRLVQ